MSISNDKKEPSGLKSLLQRARDALLGKSKRAPEQTEIDMLRHAQSNQEDSEEAQQARFQAALVQAKAALPQLLPRFTTISFDLGMASAIACAVGAIASRTGGLDDKALVALMSGLGVNWLASAVWDWRNKAANMRDPKAETLALAKTIAPNLTDERLADVVQKLGLVEATLQSIQDQGERLKLANDAVLRRMATPNQVSVHIGGDVSQSFIFSAGGDIHAQNSTFIINPGGAVANLQADLDLYLRDLAREVGEVDLTTIDPQSADADSVPIRLDSIYTPLRADGGEGAQPKDADADPMLQRMGRIGRNSRSQIEATEDQDDLIALLNDWPRVVILGDPGSGKSTALNYLTLGLCGQIKEEDQWFKAWQHRQLLPIRVELRNFARWALASHEKAASEPHWQLLDYIQERLRVAAPRLSAALRDVLAERGGAFLLDGLDEIPSGQRLMIKSTIEKLADLFPRCRFVVTCRGYSYRDGTKQIRPHDVPFTTLTVRDLGDPQIEYFVRKWYEQAGARRGTPDWESRASRLFAAITDPGNPRLHRLAVNPLLLSLIASLHSFRGGDLPRNRQELLKESVDLLLIRWQRRKKLEKLDAQEAEDERKVFEALEQRGTEGILNALYELAWDIHAGAAQGDIDNPEATADIPFTKLRAALNKVARNSLGGIEISKDAWIAYLSNRAGLVIERGDDPTLVSENADPAYRFPHRMFQEYLAAMAKQSEPDAVEKLLDADFARWREVYALIGLINSPLSTITCVDFICDAGQRPRTEAEWRRAVLAASIWADKLQRVEVPKSKVAKSVELTRQRITELLATPGVLTPSERAEAGRILAELYNPDSVHFTCADHRHAACANLRTPEGLQHYVRNGFVAIPAKGKTFTMQAGSKDAGKVTLDHDYLIGKTAVTYAQFEAFVDDADGYCNDAFWTETSLAWRGERTQPDYWQDPKWHIANHPIIGVTWYEASAYCRWLTEKLSRHNGELRVEESDGKGALHSSFSIFNSPFQVALPSEQEWEYAARRDTGRQYPWKKDLNDDWAKGDETRCNVSETRLGRTSAVGSFADGATPDGLYDLTGNVWEWLGTTWDDDWRKVKDTPEGDARRGLRGGSWGFDLEVVLGYRLRDFPDYGFDYSGFRVVVRAHFSF